MGYQAMNEMDRRAVCAIQAKVLHAYVVNITKFAAMLDLTEMPVRRWINGTGTLISGAMAIRIEEKTVGDIKREDLRPDLFDLRWCKRARKNE